MEKNTEDKAADKSEKMDLEVTKLSISSGMLGFCFVVVSYLHAAELKGKSIVDEITSMAMLVFMSNCIFSYLAIISAKFRTRQYFNITTILFLLGLLMLFFTVILIAFDLTEPFEFKK